MLAWSAAAALASGCFDRVIVSTDDEEIAAVAERLGVEAPFRRPEALSGDYALTLPVIAHAVEWLRGAGSVPEFVCCIYATAPFIRPDDLRAGLALLEENGADYAFTCTSFPYPVQRALRVNGDGRVAMIYPEFMNSRSQDCEPAFHDAGQFYWGRTEAFVAQRPMLGPASVALVVPRYRVQDIDTIEDWERAEFMHEIAQREPNRMASATWHG